MSFGNIVAERRIDLGWSQTQFGSRAGISRTYVSVIERDLAKNLSIRILLRLSRVLGIDACVLLVSYEKGEVKMDLGKVVAGVVKDLVSAGTKFTAYDVTKVVRGLHPGEDVPHDSVKAIVHGMYADGEMDSDTRVVQQTVDNLIPGSPLLYYSEDKDSDDGDVVDGDASVADVAASTDGDFFSSM